MNKLVRHSTFVIKLSLKKISTLLVGKMSFIKKKVIKFPKISDYASEVYYTIIRKSLKLAKKG